jgi:hypothetical protein
MKKVEPQVISPWATGPNKENTPWPQNFKKGGSIKKLVYKKGGSKKGYQNGPAGFGY